MHRQLTDGPDRPRRGDHGVVGTDEIVGHPRTATTICDATLSTRVRAPTPPCRRSPLDGRRGSACPTCGGWADPRSPDRLSVSRRHTRPECQELLEVGLLGPVEVRRDGRAVPVPGSPQRILLARLALSPGRPVPVTALVDLLWPDDPPANAVRNLRSYVSRLRRAIGDAPGHVGPGRLPPRRGQHGSSPRRAAGGRGRRRGSGRPRSGRGTPDRCARPVAGRAARRPARMPGVGGRAGPAARVAPRAPGAAPGAAARHRAAGQRRARARAAGTDRAAAGTTAAAADARAAPGRPDRGRPRDRARLPPPPRRRDRAGPGPGAGRPGAAAAHGRPAAPAAGPGARPGRGDARTAPPGRPVRRAGRRDRRGAVGASAPRGRQRGGAGWGRQDASRARAAGLGGRARRRGRARRGHHGGGRGRHGRRRAGSAGGVRGHRCGDRRAARPRPGSARARQLRARPRHGARTWSRNCSSTAPVSRCWPPAGGDSASRASRWSGSAPCPSRTGSRCSAIVRPCSATGSTAGRPEVREICALLDGLPARRRARRPEGSGVRAPRAARPAGRRAAGARTGSRGRPDDRAGAGRGMVLPAPRPRGTGAVRPVRRGGRRVRPQRAGPPRPSGHREPGRAARRARRDVDGAGRPLGRAAPLPPARAAAAGRPRPPGAGRPRRGPREPRPVDERAPRPRAPGAGRAIRRGHLAAAPRAGEPAGRARRADRRRASGRMPRRSPSRWPWCSATTCTWS